VSRGKIGPMSHPWLLMGHLAKFARTKCNPNRHISTYHDYNLTLRHGIITTLDTCCSIMYSNARARVGDGNRFGCGCGGQNKKYYSITLCVEIFMILFYTFVNPL